jgi:sarcosine oxidase
LSRDTHHWQTFGDEQGYYEHHAGIVRPECCIEAQLALAHQHGAALHTNERVLDYRPTSTGVEVTTPQGTYTAGKLVLCGGPWMPQLLEPALAHCFTIYRQVHYWFAARDIDPFLPGRFPIIFWGQEQTCLFVFPALAGADGGVKVSTEQLEVSTTPDTVERVVSEKEIHTMYETLVARYVPGLSERCLKALTCLYTCTPDRRFVLDAHPTHPQILIASPCSGYGFKHSAAIGEALAQLVTEGKSQIDLSGFSLRRLL